MSRFRLSFLIVLGVLTLMLAMFCAILLSKWRIDIIRSPIVDKRMNDKFVQEIGPINDLNTSIAFRNLSNLIVFTSPSQDPNDMSFVIQNKTNESIIFPDQGFGIQGFWLDEVAGEWIKIKQMPIYQQIRYILPPNTESYEGEIDNSLVIRGIDIMSKDYRQVRLYISGIGSNTGKTYGAYTDYLLLK